ncbi:HalOD1 output domain-containing protein [Natrinema salinisoli]|uniref:HalOD1 output domain-containing protein n=1 Tax=Natrinema salinisoli TaxID=2878535 RepID=UPI001CEFDE94|nr:HalOD1 output domain-containing protein [Natrinema salinisoli]
MNNTQSVSLKIVEKVAKREQVSPEELRPPLHSVIDTDALDSLYQSTISDRRSPEVEFEYKGYTVTVDSTGDVDIRHQVSTVEPTKQSCDPL